MSLERYFRNGSNGTIWIRSVLASILLFGLLAARDVPSHFFCASGFHSASSDSHHDQRPRFDHAAWDWSAPVGTFFLFPPAGESAHLMPSPRLFSTLQTKGFHFNRPPPIA
jgi:hypothetical protein